MTAKFYGVGPSFVIGKALDIRRAGRIFCAAAWPVTCMPTASPPVCAACPAPKGGETVRCTVEEALNRLADHVRGRAGGGQSCREMGVR